MAPAYTIRTDSARSFTSRQRPTFRVPPYGPPYDRSVKPPARSREGQSKDFPLYIDSESESSDSSAAEEGTAAISPLSSPASTEQDRFHSRETGAAGTPRPRPERLSDDPAACQPLGQSDREPRSQPPINLPAPPVMTQLEREQTAPESPGMLAATRLGLDCRGGESSNPRSVLPSAPAPMLALPSLLAAPGHPHACSPPANSGSDDERASWPAAAGTAPTEDGGTTQQDQDATNRASKAPPPFTRPGASALAGARLAPGAGSQHAPTPRRAQSSGDRMGECGRSVRSPAPSPPPASETCTPAPNAEGPPVSRSATKTNSASDDDEAYRPPRKRQCIARRPPAAPVRRKGADRRARPEPHEDAEPRSILDILHVRDEQPAREDPGEQDTIAVQLAVPLRFRQPNRTMPNGAPPRLQELEEIVDEQEGMYYIKWEGWPSSDNTWEPRHHLTNCKEALGDFYERRRRAARAGRPS